MRALALAIAAAVLLPPSILAQDIPANAHETASEWECDTGYVERGGSCVRAGPSDEEIRRILIRRSIASYSGSCPCPYNTDRGGRRCGGRSAYSRPGGASPMCYARDASDAQVQRYREQNFPDGR